jgi:transketolase
MSLEEIIKTTRNDILTMTTEAGSGHPGGSLSCVEIIVGIYEIMTENDVFILSKGHAAPTLYSILSQRGVIDRESLMTLRKLGGLQGHPVKGEGVYVSTGSLGQGLSIACGTAIAKKLDHKDGTVYCLLGDGECQEGMVWEAATMIGERGLNNIVAIVDNNGYGVDGKVECKLNWDGWEIHEIKCGNSIKDVLDSFSYIKLANRVYGNRPLLFIAHTTKGFGVKKMEGNNEYHGKVLTKEKLGECLL